MKQIVKSLVLASLALGNYAVAAPSDAPSDTQIAKIVITANTGEVEQGEYAKTHATNEKVSEFAKDMIADHSASKSETVALATKLNMVPSDSDISKKLASDGAKEMEELKKLSGAAFDKRYVDIQVKAHTAVLDLFDRKLIPNAQVPELKALLEKTRPVIAAHLEHAKRVQSMVTKKKM